MKFKIIKILLIILVFGIVIFYLKYALYLLVIHKGVGETKAISPFVSGDLLGNGYRHFILYEPILYLGDEPQWHTCVKVNSQVKKDIVAISNNKLVLAESLDFSIYESPHLINIYFKHNDKLILLDAFEDSSGIMSIEPGNFCEELKE